MREVRLFLTHLEPQTFGAAFDTKSCRAAAATQIVAASEWYFFEFALLY